MDIHTKFVHLQLNVKGSWFLLAKWISLETQMYKGKIDTFSIILFASKPPSKGTFSRCLAVSCLCAHTHTFYICPWHTTPTSNTWWDFQDRSLRDWGTWSKMTWVKSRYDRNDFCFLFDRFVILSRNRKKKEKMWLYDLVVFCATALCGDHYESKINQAQILCMLITPL